MRVLVTADLHLEFWTWMGRRLFQEQRNTIRDLDGLIIAGDLINDPERNCPAVLEQVSEMSLTFGDARFLICTLWSDFALNGTAEHSMRVAKRSINDYNLIRKTWDGARIEPEDTLAVHRDHLAWLDEELGREWDGKTVVVTHYGPHRSIAGKVDEITPVFVFDLDWLIGKHPLLVWLFGYTHRHTRATVHGTEVRNISISYPSEIAWGMDNLLMRRGIIDTHAPGLLTWKG